MTVLDRRILKTLLEDAGYSQKQIAEKLKVPQSAVTRSLLAFKQRGMVELGSKGKPPRLSLFSKIAQLEEAARDLLRPVLEAAL
ncbi:MAG TPA: winged helix-turn-helix domain-containing protein [Candidatus Baltobacteraceae bacterium]|jgi:transposase|nr:winged helix-turn-helix domain-containing protein [Candidatus Baltobacteraceae bacterium]